MPGLDLAVVDALGLKNIRHRLCVDNTGCYGSFSALTVGQAFVAAEPDAVVLVICTEVCSVHINKHRLAFKFTYIRTLPRSCYTFPRCFWVFWPQIVLDFRVTISPHAFYTIPRTRIDILIFSAGTDLRFWEISSLVMVQLPPSFLLDRRETGR